MDRPTPGSPDSDQVQDPASEGATQAPGRERSGAERRTRPRFSWPPPGLEHSQGHLWLVILQLGLGNLILVLPLLLAVAREYPFWSFGLFAGAWWVLILTCFLGLFITLYGLEALFRLLRDGLRANRRGLGWFTAFLAMTDRDKDGGFLLQGARAYKGLDAVVRRRMARLRVVGGVSDLGGMLWIPLGFSVSVILAARGLLSPTTMWYLTLVPALALLVVGVVARAWDRSLRGKVKAPKTEVEEEIRVAATDWLAVRVAYGEVETDLEADTPTEAAGRFFRFGSVGALLIAVLLFLPVTALMVTSTMGPILGMLAVPQFVRMNERAVKAEALRRLRVEPDPEITPQEAGEAFNALMYVADTRPRLDLMQSPVRQYDEPWIPDGVDEAIGIAPHLWAVELFPALRQGLSGEARAFLARVAANPAQQEMEILARAVGADLAGTRWTFPIPDSINMMGLPIPRFSGVRSAAHARVGIAALQLASGQPAEAEETLREIISAGFLVADEGPTLIDNLIGYMIVNIGADALESYYAAAGRDEDAANLRWARETAEAAERLTRATRVRGDIQSALQSMSDIVTSPETIRGMRWEFFTVLNTIGPCMNAHRVVFGPDDRFNAWLEEARSNMVRYPSEAELFLLARTGYLGTRIESTSGGWLTRILSLGLGGGQAPGSCAATLGLAPQIM